MSVELPEILFATQQAWEEWLEENHQRSDGFWMQIAKKGSGIDSVTYVEAVEVALCFGWIDGQKRSKDERIYLQKFTPRRPRSVWSKVNIARIEALEKAGRMRPSGLKEVAAAKADGRWDAAYDPASTATVPEDLQAALDSNPKAREFFDSLNSSNRYAILYRIQEAKRPETRTKRIDKFVAMCERGEKIHNL